MKGIGGLVVIIIIIALLGGAIILVNNSKPATITLQNIQTVNLSAFNFPADNITAGQFGRNFGNGSYIFPVNLTIVGNLTLGKICSAGQVLSNNVTGIVQCVSASAGSGDNAGADNKTLSDLINSNNITLNNSIQSLSSNVENNRLTEVSNNQTQNNLINLRLLTSAWLSENTTIQNTYETISRHNSDNTTVDNRITVNNAIILGLLGQKVNLSNVSKACTGTDKVSNITIDNGVPQIVCTTDQNSGSGSGGGNATASGIAGFFSYFFNATHLISTPVSLNGSTVFFNSAYLNLTGDLFVNGINVTGQEIADNKTLSDSINGKVNLSQNTSFQCGTVDMVFNVTLDAGHIQGKCRTPPSADNAGADNKTLSDLINTKPNFTSVNNFTGSVNYFVNANFTNISIGVLKAAACDVKADAIGGFLYCGTDATGGAAGGNTSSSGAANYFPLFTDTTNLTTSVITMNGSSVYVNVGLFGELNVTGDIQLAGNYYAGSVNVNGRQVADNTTVAALLGQKRNLSDVFSNASASGQTGYISQFFNATHLIISDLFSDNTSVGIGTTLPNALLHISGVNTASNLSFNIERDTSNPILTINTSTFNSLILNGTIQQSTNQNASAGGAFININNGSNAAAYFLLGTSASKYGGFFHMGNAYSSIAGFPFQPNRTMMYCNDGGGCGIGSAIAGANVTFFAGGVLGSNVVAVMKNTGDRLTVFGNVNASAYRTNGSDYAEIVPKLNLTENITSGDIVGIINGSATKNTANTNKIYVVSGTYIGILAGSGDVYDRTHINITSGPNITEVEATTFKTDYTNSAIVPISFVGQIMVKINGTCTDGDWVLPNSLNNGYGTCSNFNNVTTVVDLRNKILNKIGTAWQTNLSVGTKFVKIAIGK